VGAGLKQAGIHVQGAPVQLDRAPVFMLEVLNPRFVGHQAG